MSHASYFSQLGRLPLLSRDEEHALAERLQRTGDPGAADRLVTANLRLVVKLAREYQRRGTELLELVQEGNLGLLEAVRRFDPSRGVKLASYASFWIRAYILKYLITSARLVRLGTTQAQRRLFFGLAKARLALEHEGLQASAEQIAARVGVKPAVVREMTTRMATPEVSLDVTQSMAGSEEAPDVAFERAQLHALIEGRVDAFARRLGERDRTLFEQRWRGEDQVTLAELGDQFHVSRERVRQLEQRLLARLRSELAGLRAA
jgi:RNA polymerase sigma-32 factor